MKILLLPGDGIGLEIAPWVEAALGALDARFDLGLELRVEAIGLASLPTHGTCLPDGIVEAARQCDGVILGPVDSMAYPPRDQGGVSAVRVLRRELDLYANIRPSKIRDGVPATVEGLDLVIMRENTEGFYADRSMHRGSGEILVTEDVAISVRKITRRATERIARAACEVAMRRRKALTIVTKKNVLSLSDGLFYDAARAVADAYPEITVDHVLVDAMTALLVRCPERFDVIVTSNMFGDILSDLASELAGGLGLGASVNAGDHHIMAQAVHGSASDIAGQDRANPTALLHSTAMLLEQLGARCGRADLIDAARCLEGALDALLADPERRTVDLGGPLGTRAFGEALVKALSTPA